MAEPLWRLRGVRVGGRLRVDHLDLLPGLTAVVGPSGAGKTTLLDVLAGFQRPQTGTVATALPAAAPPLAWSPREGEWPHLSVERQLALAGGRDAEELIAAFALGHRRQARPATLSSGERERLSVARALATGAPVVVLDEPFSHLDPALADHCWDALLAVLARRGASAVWSTHVPERVMGTAGQVVLLRDGAPLWQGAVDEAWHRPPSATVALALGPANWLEPADAALVAGAAPGCLRPDRLVLAADGGGAAQVLASRSHGLVGVSDLDHGDGHSRRWWHRPALLAAGQRVALHVAGLLLCLGLAACGGGDPVLAVSGQRAWNLPAEGGALPAPRAATAAPDGGATVLDTAGRVLDYAADGTLRRSWFMPEWTVGRPEGAVWLPDGRLAVADTHYHRVVLFDRSGRHCGGFGSEGDGPGQFRYPVGACCDAAGRLYISEYGGNDRIQVFAPDGTHLRSFGGFGTAPGQLQRPQSLCWHDGVLYVADTMNNRIAAYRDDGTFLAILGGDRPPELRFPYGVALLADRTLLVAEYAAARLTRLGRDGRLLGRQGGPGRDLGGYDTPWGLGVDRDGQAWICDTGNRRLQLLLPGTP